MYGMLSFASGSAVTHGPLLMVIDPWMRLLACYASPIPNTSCSIQMGDISKLKQPEEGKLFIGPMNRPFHHRTGYCRIVRPQIRDRKLHMRSWASRAYHITYKQLLR